MNPIWISAIVGAVLGHQRTTRRVSSTPKDHRSAQQSPRTPLKSILDSLRGMVKRVRGSRNSRG